MPRLSLRRPWLRAGCLCLFGGLAGQGLAQELAPRDVELDWRLGLRGGYAGDSQAGARADIVLVPEITVLRQGLLDTSELAGGGAVALASDGTLRLDDFHARAKSTLRLDRLTTLEGGIELRLSRASPGDPSLASDISVAPQLSNGSAAASATRRFGRFEVALRGAGQRFVEGESVLVGGTRVDNTSQNYWRGEAGLRVGYEISPALTVFVDAAGGQQTFDIAAPGLGRFLDNRGSVLRGGLAWGRDDRFSGELSAGRAVLDFTDPALTDRAAWVVGASTRFRPDPTVTLTADLDSSIQPSATVAGAVDLNLSLGAAARYLVNPWLALRGSAAWNRADTLGTAYVATTYSGGVGVDYQSTRHLTWNADYLYAHTDPVGGDSRDSQQVMVGATIRR